MSNQILGGLEGSSCSLNPNICRGSGFMPSAVYIYHDTMTFVFSFSYCLQCLYCYVFQEKTLRVETRDMVNKS
jgi:hypothetical protein